MDAFNDVAGDKGPVLPSLMESLQKLRRNIALTDAAKRQDWQACENLCAEGADLYHRGSLAIREITSHCSMEVVRLLEKIQTPELPELVNQLLVPAAAENQRDIVDYILQKKPGAGYINEALFAALRNDHKEISDLLLEELGAEHVEEKTLIAMQLHRPDFYDKVTAARPYPQDYMMHFINACTGEDHAAMDRALDKMIAEADAVKQRLGFDEDVMMGFGYQEALIYLLPTGDLPIIDKFLDHFLDSLKNCFPSPDMLVMIALSTMPDNADVVSHLVDRLKAGDRAIGVALSYAAQMRRMPFVERMMEIYPDVAKEHSDAVLGALASAPGKEKEFFAALQDGYALPEEERGKLALLTKALAAKNAGIAAHLEAMIEMTPAVVAVMQSHADTEVLKRAAELGNDWRFGNDLLYWRALSENDAGVLTHFPGGETVSLPSKYLARAALDEVVDRGDMEQLADVLTRGPWDDEIMEAAFKCCLGSPEAAEKIPLLDYPARLLTADDLRAITAEKGEETLRILGAQGFSLSPEALAAGLERAAGAGAATMAEYLLTQGAVFTPEPTKVLAAADRGAGIPMVDVLEKWVLRERDIHLAGTAVATAPEGQMFQGADSVAVQAAYAGKFPLVMQKAALSNFDPAILAQTKDNHGNSVLDILGAHGRLNDILVPEVWKDRDAVSFIRENVPPCYQAQCDFNGLKAGLDQLRLKDLGRRARIGLKGP